MDSKAIRRRNLKALIKRFRTQRALADKAALSVAHVSQLNTGNREMGDPVARRIETHLALGLGWMDNVHDDATPDLPLSIEEPRAYYGGTAEKRQLLLLFERLTQEQRRGFIAELQAAVRANETVLRELRVTDVTASAAAPEPASPARARTRMETP